MNPNQDISASRRSGQTDSVGTVHYMAPEIAQGRYGKEIDLYALGIMTYEMLTGRVPFDGQSPAEILMKHLTALPDTSTLPEPYRAAVGRLLAKEPRERYPSVQGLFWLTLIPMLIGFAMCIVPGLLLATIWLFPSFLIVDKNLGVFRSLGTSHQIVSRKGFGLNLLLALIVFMLAMAPGAIPWIGFVLGWFVAPIGWLMETSAYI